MKLAIKKAEKDGKPEDHHEEAEVPQESDIFSDFLAPVVTHKMSKIDYFSKNGNKL